MPLDLVSEFRQQDILSLKVYKQGKVYLLRGSSQDIVVKQEDIAVANQTHFDMSKKAMGVIDKNVKSSKRLTPGEIQALNDFVSLQRAKVQFGLQDRLPGATADLDLALLALRQLQKVWFKMPHTPMMTLGEAWESKLGNTFDTNEKSTQSCAQSDEPMRIFAMTLKAPGGLESLGQVIAADIFSGNTDRVSLKGLNPNKPGARLKGPLVTETLGTTKYQLKAIRNVGNIIIIGGGPARTISGMDFADPNSILKHANDSLSQQEQKGDWHGHVLADKIQRKQLAKDVISDLEMILTSGAHLHKIKKDFFGRTASDQSVLGMNAAKRLEEGMLKGVRALNKYIKDKSKNKQFPQSFQERAAIYAKIA